MAKAKSKNNAKKNNAFNYDFCNKVELHGTVTKIVCDSDNVMIYNVDIPTKTPKGNTAHTWVNVVDFNCNVAYEENDAIKVVGALQTNTYDSKNGKVYQLRVVADSIDTIEEIPFN